MESPAIHLPEPEQVYQKELHISWKKPEGGHKLVVLNLNDGEFYSLEDPVSIEIWEKLMTGQTPAGILEDLTTRYAEQDRATLAQDVDGFIGELLTHKLICPWQSGGATA